MANSEENDKSKKRGPGRPRKVVSTSKAKPKVVSKKVVKAKAKPRKKAIVKKALPGTKGKENKDHQFQPGNQLWHLRSKDGRDKIFTTPLDLWERGCEYFNYQDSNPFIKEEWKSFGGVATKVETNVMKPYTLIGMCIFLNVSSSYFRKFKSVKKKEIKEGNEVELNNDYITVIEKLEEIIYNQKYEGAASNFLNANIIARDLGLSEKIEEVKEVVEEEKTLEELKAELEKLERWEK